MTVLWWMKRAFIFPQPHIIIIISPHLEKPPNFPKPVDRPISATSFRTSPRGHIATIINPIDWRDWTLHIFS